MRGGHINGRYSPAARADGISKIRRNEETKLPVRVHRRRPSGRQLGTRESQIQTARDRMRLGSAVPAFARRAKRVAVDARIPRVRLARWRQPVCLSICLLRFFGSSILRRYRGPSQRDSERTLIAISRVGCGTMIAATLILHYHRRHFRSPGEPRLNHRRS